MSASKRPLLKGWSRLCDEPLTEAEIREIARRHPLAGLGVACGYCGLVAVDIDTDDPDIIAAIRSVLGESAVSRRGQKGRADFYLTGRDVPSRQIKAKDGKVLVDVLSRGRQVVIPPTLHPVTGESYTWLSRATLLNTPLDALPTSAGG